MTKRVLAVAACLIFTASFAQKKTEKTFSYKIDGTIRNFTGKKVYVHHVWNDKNITDSATVKDEKFSFNLKAVEPAMHWVTLSREVSAQPNFFFFSDNAPIKLNLIADSLNFSTALGGPNQAVYDEYRGMINRLVQEQQKMQSDYMAASQKGDGQAMQAIQQEFQGLNARYMAGLKEFIRNHSKSEMSAHILTSDLSNENIPIENLIEALDLIDPSLSNNSHVLATRKKVDMLRGSMVGYPANNFTQSTPEGKSVKLSDYKGKYVLIDFWASWCKPCRMENPNVVAAYNRFKDKGFTVLGVSMDSNREAWVNAIRADNLTWQHVSDLKGWGNEVGIMYGVKGIPQNFLVDKEGKIVAKNLRGAELDEKLAEIIK